jgi:hypothetical protein
MKNTDFAIVLGLYWIYLVGFCSGRISREITAFISLF